MKTINDAQFFAGLILLFVVSGALMFIDAAAADQGITRIVIVDEKNYFGAAKMYFYQHEPGNITGVNRYIMSHNFGDNITLANGVNYKVAIKEDMGTAAVDRVLGFDQATIINIVLSVVVILLIAALIYYIKNPLLGCPSFHAVQHRQLRALLGLI
jgi:hypothetical protein